MNREKVLVNELRTSYKLRGGGVFMNEWRKDICELVEENL